MTRSVSSLVLVAVLGLLIAPLMIWSASTLIGEAPPPPPANSAAPPPSPEAIAAEIRARGDRQRAAGRYRQAVASYEEALGQHADADLAALLRDTRQEGMRAALSVGERAVARLTPPLAPAADAALAATIERSLREAATFAEEGDEAATPPEAAALQGAALMLNGDLPGAEAAWAQAMASASDETAATALEDRISSYRAGAALRADLAQSDAEAAYADGVALYRAGDFAHARERLAAAAYSLDEDGGDALTARALNNLAVLADASGDIQGAEALLTAAQRRRDALGPMGQGVLDANLALTVYGLAASRDTYFRVQMYFTRFETSTEQATGVESLVVRDQRLEQGDVRRLVAPPIVQQLGDAGEILLSRLVFAAYARNAYEAAYTLSSGLAEEEREMIAPWRDVSVEGIDWALNDSAGRFLRFQETRCAKHAASDAEVAERDAAAACLDDLLTHYAVWQDDLDRFSDPSESLRQDPYARVVEIAKALDRPIEAAIALSHQASRALDADAGADAGDPSALLEESDRLFAEAGVDPSLAPWGAATLLFETGEDAAFGRSEYERARALAADRGLLWRAAKAMARNAETAGALTSGGQPTEP